MGKETLSKGRYLSETVGIAVLYFVLAKAGQTVAIPPGNVTSVWPPSGLALTAFLLFGNRAWLGTFIGAYIANASFFDFTSPDIALRSLATGTMIGVGSFLQPFAGRFLVHRRIGRESGAPLESVTGFLKFCGIIPIMCLVSASFGSTSLTVGGYAPWEGWRELWFTWWLGDSVGVFVITPLLLAWRPGSSPLAAGGRSVEIVVLLAAIATSSLIAFTSAFGAATKGYPLEFLPLPFLLWAALRLGTRGATTYILVVEVIAILGTATRQSPFIVDSVNHSLLLLQLFILVITMTLVVLAIFVEQNRRAEQALREAHDVLEQRVRERTVDLEAARVAAESANRSKSVFLANISHEIRTPMNAILGFTEIVKRSTTELQNKEYLSSIESSGKSLLSLINDILDLSRAESGSLELQPAAADTVKIFSDVEAEYSTKASEKGLSFNVNVDPGIPRSIEVDERRVSQVLGNLVDNAVKFTESGQVKVSVRSVPSESKDGYIDLSFDVEDTGIGIPNDQIDELFNAFTQRRGQSINEYGGTGLGLVLSQRLVEMMQGRIMVASEEGVGSTFHVALPGVKVVDGTTLGDLQMEAEVVAGAEETAVSTWSPEDMSLEAKGRLPELVSVLKSQRATCEELAATQTVNEVEAFAHQMKATAEQYEYPPLEEWSEKLARQTEMFNMDGISASLAEFSSLIGETESYIG